MIAPLIVLGAVGLSLRWLIRKARTDTDDMIDEAKGATAGRHLPSVSPDVRDLLPRSLAVDADTERYRNALPGGGT